MDAALDAWQPHLMGEGFKVGDWEATLHVAGHIPGAAMVEIDTPDLKVLWSGDLDTRDSPNVTGAKPIECDVLCLEGTYGG